MLRAVGRSRARARAGGKARSSFLFLYVLSAYLYLPTYLATYGLSYGDGLGLLGRNVASWLALAQQRRSLKETKQNAKEWVSDFGRRFRF